MDDACGRACYIINSAEGISELIFSHIIDDDLRQKDRKLTKL
jgi:hypothetical protein